MRRPVEPPATGVTPVVVVVPKVKPPEKPATDTSPKAPPPATGAPARGAPATTSTAAPPAAPRSADSTRVAHSPALVRPPGVAREFRAAWVTPLYGARGADWPSVPGLSPDSQRAELRALLDRAKAVGLNAIILHVRIAGDALYPTAYAPWSAFLTGREGRPPEPAYDPLAYAVTQAHARGLQLHAWFNPFRARYPGTRWPNAASQVTRTHPDWIRRYGQQTWIDPGIPAARAFVLATILDVVRRYDIDGVHIDDYFYPYRESETIVHRRRRRRRLYITRTVRDIDFPDDRSWRRYGAPAGFTDRADWRRANIDGFVQALYDSVKAIKPWVLVGISPFGIWRPGAPPGITGLDAYAEIYADSRRWLREGWLDYLVPQLYWPLSGDEQRFARLDAWWRSENVLGRHVWPGLEAEMTTGGRDPWPTSDITDEISFLRQGGPSGGDEGHVVFRFGSLGAGAGSLARALRDSLYMAPALVPASPWLDARYPAPPRVAAAGGVPSLLAVQPGDSVRVAWWLVQAEDAEGRWTTRVLPADSTRIDVGDITGRTPAEVAITAIGRTGVAGVPTLLPLALALDGSPR